MATEIRPTNDGIAFARTRDGLTLPIIDVSHPSFAIPDDQESLAAHHVAFLEWHRRQQRIPDPISKLVLRFAAKQSPLLRAVFQSRDGYLDSITTYIMKLGADNLPAGFDSLIDRKVASAPHVVLL